MDFVNTAMDSDSDYEKGAPSTDTPTPIEAFSVESLIQRVDEFQRRDQLETIERLIIENSLLQRRVIMYQKHWYLTIDLLEKAYKAILSL
jgi:hypothetical protein